MGGDQRGSRGSVNSHFLLSPAGEPPSPRLLPAAMLPGSFHRPGGDDLQTLPGMPIHHRAMVTDWGAGVCGAPAVACGVWTEGLGNIAGDE